MFGTLSKVPRDITVLTILSGSGPGEQGIYLSFSFPSPGLLGIACNHRWPKECLR